jgi:hypothetical protein
VKTDLALVCDHAIVDQVGKLSVIGIFERIWVQSFPTVHPRLHLVLRLKGRRTEVGEHPVVILLRDPDGTEVLRGDGTVHIGEPPAGVTEVEASAVLPFDVPLDRAGTYHFEILVDGRQQALVPVIVTAMPHAPHQTPPGVH